jgi:hypothetical protein
MCSSYITLCMMQCSTKLDTGWLIVEAFMLFLMTSLNGSYPAERSSYLRQKSPR